MKAVDTSTIKVESIPETDPEPETVEAGSAVNGKEDELARVDSASKATDSDVEAARAKTNSKKSKKKNKKKGGVEA